MTAIAKMIETMRQIERVQREIEEHLAHIATLLDGVVKHGEVAPFVEWAEPPECKKDQP